MTTKVTVSANGGDYPAYVYIGEVGLGGPSTVTTLRNETRDFYVHNNHAILVTEADLSEDLAYSTAKPVD